MKLIEIFHFQDDTSIIMEETSQNPTNCSNAKPGTKMSQVTDFILFLIVSLIGAVLILALVLFFQGLLLPKACTENSQSPIVKFESQIREDFTELIKPLENVDAWFENNLNDNVKFVMKYLVIFLELAFVYHLLHSIYISQSAITTFSMSLCVNGCFILFSMLLRYYFFQDSSEDCKIGLDMILHINQINCGSFFVLLAFIAFQQFLTKNCGK